MPGHCHVGVDGDLGTVAFPTLKLFSVSVVSPLTMLEDSSDELLGGASLNRFAFPLGGSGKCSNSTQATSYRGGPDFLTFGDPLVTLSTM